MMRLGPIRRLIGRCKFMMSPLVAWLGADETVLYGRFQVPDTLIPRKARQPTAHSHLASAQPGKKIFA